MSSTTASAADSGSRCVVCEDSHLCFGKEVDRHSTSHLCFGRRHRPNLEPLEVSAVSEVIEEAVHQLAILGKTLPMDPSLDWGQGQDFQDVDARFAKPPRPKWKCPEMAGEWPPETEAMLKVQRDRLFAEKVLSGVLTELREKGSFSSLKTRMEWQSAMAADEERLLLQCAEGKEKRQTAREQLRRDKQKILEQETFWEQKSDFLTSNLHDTRLLGGLATSYAKIWERTRQEQQQLIFNRKESALRGMIDRIGDPDLPNEERVHAEIMNFLAKDTEIIKGQLEHWTDLYDAEMMKRETENLHLRNALEQRKEQHKAIQEDARYRKRIMENAAQLRSEYEKKQRSIANVIAIQAWWRGVSFRVGFSTRKSKKKKGKKKRKKRGKKKKVKTKSKL